jgi:predicted 3-demethylubiquinone-9 3-methyltransferase (glyoxalase superfamily)
MAAVQRICPCLWFDGRAEEAANFYVGIFKNAKITHTQRYTEVGREHHGQEPGTVMVVAFEIEGQAFTALNGGPLFKFTEAVSFQIMCDSQAEVDHYWDRLCEGADPDAQNCGWLKDKFGVSWQVVPKALIEMISDKDSAKSQRAMGAMMQMKKIDIAACRRAFEG